MLRLPLGRRQLVAGPSRNRNLPHVVLGRARLHHVLVAGRAHAERGALDLGTSARELLAPLDDTTRRQVERTFGRLRSGREIGEATDQLARLAAQIFAGDETASPG
jgi:hypothetical protein